MVAPLSDSSFSRDILPQSQQCPVRLRAPNLYQLERGGPEALLLLLLEKRNLPSRPLDPASVVTLVPLNESGLQESGVTMFQSTTHRTSADDIEGALNMGVTNPFFVHLSEKQKSHFSHEERVSLRIPMIGFFPLAKEIAESSRQSAPTSY